MAESSRRRRGMAESRGHQHAHKAARRRLTPKASRERPDA
jgi:hypothetical protein